MCGLQQHQRSVDLTPHLLASFVILYGLVLLICQCQQRLQACCYRRCLEKKGNISDSSFQKFNTLSAAAFIKRGLLFHAAGFRLKYELYISRKRRYEFNLFEYRISEQLQSIFSVRCVTSSFFVLFIQTLTEGLNCDFEKRPSSWHLRTNLSCFYLRISEQIQSIF